MRTKHAEPLLYLQLLLRHINHEPVNALGQKACLTNRSSLVEKRVNLMLCHFWFMHAVLCNYGRIE